MAQQKNEEVKARCFVAVMYPESMRPNWEEDIADILEMPLAYCIHDKDIDPETGQLKKAHVHIMLMFNNTTTYSNAISIYQRIGIVGLIKVVKNQKRMYDYLIHDTDDCRKKKKHLYDASERICLNGFRIKRTLEGDELDEIQKKIIRTIYKYRFKRHEEAWNYFDSIHDEDSLTCLCRRGGSIQSAFDSVYQKYKEDMQNAQAEELAAARAHQKRQETVFLSDKHQSKHKIGKRSDRKKAG